MTKIQLLLIGLIVAGTAIGWFAFGAKLLLRLAMFTLMLLGIYFVAMPDHTTAIARFLGVGRGTDLLLYVGIIAGGYAILLVYLRTRRLEQKLTEHVRAMALLNATPPADRP